MIDTICCADCRYFSRALERGMFGTFKGYRCRRPGVGLKNKITGEIYYPECSNERQFDRYDDRCGYEAKHFKQSTSGDNHEGEPDGVGCGLFLAIMALFAFFMMLISSKG